jgi:tRNA(Arg) A34 adenosine deaminase TadA
MFDQPSRIEFSLPTWICEFVNNVPVIQDIDDRVAFVIEACRRNIIKKTGGPFAAAVFERDTGKLVSLGVNLVQKEQLSILHAEIIAITLAQRKLGTYDLGAPGLASHELVTSTEPCAMCFGAIPWSGVHRVVTSARDADARSIGFDEGPKLSDWRAALEQRGIEVICDVRRAEAKAVLSEYAQNGGLIYNSKGAFCQTCAQERKLTP